MNFYEWIIEERKISIDQWREEHIKDYFEKIRSLMNMLESKGIKTRILCWENDYLELIKNDLFMYNRYIDFEYRGSTFPSIRDLMSGHPHLTINSDYDHFQDPPKDHHPSKECHDVIAKNVIRFIEKDLENQKEFVVKEEDFKLDPQTSVPTPKRLI